jgi:DNA helicase-2/ATP-dependent DNA helicase PcrA
MAANEADQAAFVAQRVLELRDEGTDLSAICVLYRSHWHSMELQIELNRRRIPFVVRSGLRFFEQRHIKDILSFLKFASNHRDALSFQRFATLVDGIGPVVAKRLFEAVASARDPAIQLAASGSSVPRRAQVAWAQLATVVARVLQPELITRAAAALELLRSAFYDDHLTRRDDNASARIRDLDTLVAYAAQHGSVPEFLDSLALDPGAGVDVEASDHDDEALVLSSVHQAKGLEFDAVFVIWVAESHFPSPRADSGDDIEEERRLFYVAATRARRDLYLCRPSTAYDRRQGLVYLRTSPFIEEISRLRPAVYEDWRIDR